MIDLPALLVASTPSVVLLGAWVTRRALDSRELRRHAAWLAAEQAQRMAAYAAEVEAISDRYYLQALDRTIARANLTD